MAKSGDFWKVKQANKPMLLGQNKHSVYRRQYQRRDEGQILQGCVFPRGYALIVSEEGSHVFQVFSVVTDSI